MAEPVDLPFGLWTRVGRRKEKFNRVRRGAPMCPRGEYMVLKTKPFAHQYLYYHLTVSSD